jgi:hypothetical protein
MILLVLDNALTTLNLSKLGVKQKQPNFYTCALLSLKAYWNCTKIANFTGRNKSLSTHNEHQIPQKINTVTVLLMHPLKLCVMYLPRNYLLILLST